MQKRSFLSLFSSIKSKIPNWIINLISITLTIFLSFVALEYASGIEVFGMHGYLKKLGPTFVMVNILTVGIFWSILYILCNRVWLANLLCGIICGGISIANYYVLALHGMPLSFLVLRNFTTAMNVLDSYNLTLDTHVIRMLILTIGLVMMAILVRFLSKPKKISLGKTLIRNGILLAVCCIVFSVCYLGETPIKPKKTIGWLWTNAYHQYGYAACTVETLFQSISGANVPDGYSEEAVENITIVPSEQNDPQTPDVLLILNETFYDIRQIIDIQTDVPLMPNMESMDNLLTGYAVIPGAGGGTNSAEYELLTSNSLELMPGVTPFNTINLNGANSIVSHLNALGYYTLGSHSEPAVNYSRNSGYKALQFQQSYFEPDFQDVSYYYDRHFETDESVYNNLIRWYHEAPAENPRFLYLLTIQNHGGYEMNAPEYDTVHLLNDFGEYTGMIEEFLTCQNITDQAFADLTAYFSTVDRPVIICMVGDHAPSFSKHIIDPKYSGAESDLRHRTVPLVYWANYPLEETQIGTMSMNYVVPYLLKLANIRTSPYYDYMLQIRQDVPILTSYGNYVDRDGKFYSYDTDQGGAYEKIVNNYFYLEYENLKTKHNQELFDPNP